MLRGRTLSLKGKTPRALSQQSLGLLVQLLKIPSASRNQRFYCNLNIHSINSDIFKHTELPEGIKDQWGGEEVSWSMQKHTCSILKLKLVGGSGEGLKYRTIHNQMLQKSDRRQTALKNSPLFLSDLCSSWPFQLTNLCAASRSPAINVSLRCDISFKAHNLMHSSGLWNMQLFFCFFF